MHTTNANSESSTTWPRHVVLGLVWGTLAVAGMYFIQRDAITYLDYSQEAYRYHWALRGWLIVHILGAGPALLIAPLQFSTRIRTGWPHLHRAAGRIYVFGGLIASAAALRLAIGSRCELCMLPLAMLATLWFVTTATAYWLATKRAYATHRQFMIRSYVLMNAFVVIRLSDFVPIPIPIEDEEARRSVFEWACWTIPLLITEICLSWVPALKKAQGMAAARIK